MDIRVESYSFRDNFQPVSVEIKEGCPTDYLVAFCGVSRIIRGGYIDSGRKILELRALVERVNPSKDSFFLSVNQNSSTEKEWDLIERQYLLWRESGKEAAHLIFSLEDLYFIPPPEGRLEKEKRFLRRLPRLLNVPGWLSLCGRYNGLLERAFSRFAYDAVDEYTLERYIEDFRHEVYSDFLEKTLIRLAGLEKRGEGDLITREKTLIFCRLDLTRMLRAHYNILGEIVKGIELVEESRPELIAVKQTGALLHRLLEEELNEDADLSWLQKEILLQLLDERLGAISVINCAGGMARSEVSFALRLALFQLRRDFSEERIFSFAFSADMEKEPLLGDLKRKTLENILDYAPAPINEGGGEINPEILSCLPTVYKGRKVVEKGIVDFKRLLPLRAR